MKFTPGPMISQASGSVGGQTFSRNRGGQYVRARAIPLTSTTSFALAAKARLATASTSWQGLTTAERLSWRQWADANPVINTLGSSITLTGQQAYVGNHTRLALGGFVTLNVPPIIPAPNALTSATQGGDIGLGDVDLAFAPSPLGAAEFLWMQAAVVNSPGINYIQNLLRFIGISAAAATTPFDNEALITARLGTLTVGQTLSVVTRVFSSASGLLSQPIRANVVISTT